MLNAAGEQGMLCLRWCPPSAAFVQSELLCRDMLSAQLHIADDSHPKLLITLLPGARDNRVYHLAGDKYNKIIIHQSVVLHTQRSNTYIC